MTTPKELSVEFVRAFCDGDVCRIGDLLAADFRFTGPYLGTSTRTAYLESLESDPPAAGAGFTVLGGFEDGDRACLIYEYSKAEGSILTAQLTRCSGDKISEMLLIFDARAPQRHL